MFLEMTLIFARALQDGERWRKPRLYPREENFRVKVYPDGGGSWSKMGAPIWNRFRLKVYPGGGRFLVEDERRDLEPS
jgi:hypothetical protein